MIGIVFAFKLLTYILGCIKLKPSSLALDSYSDVMKYYDAGLSVGDFDVISLNEFLC